MLSGSRNSNRVAIVGASSLLGKELKQVLEDRNFPASDIALLDETVQAGILTEAGGEPTFIRSLEKDSFEGVAFAFFAGTTPDAGQNWTLAQRAGATVIDLTGAAVSSGKAAIWIPSVSSVLPPPPGAASQAGVAPAYGAPTTPVIVGCTLVAGLAEWQVERLMVTLFAPVSERDQAGVEELETQSRGLLSFREIGMPIFDTQVAFSILSQYGEKSKARLEDVRNTISHVVSAYLAGRLPVPAIQLVHAPVFYGYAFAAYAEFKSPASPESLEKSFKSLGVSVAKSGEPAPSNISVAGENIIHLAPPTADPSVTNGLWLWGAADNLRLAAVNAVQIAEVLIARSHSN